MALTLKTIGNYAVGGNIERDNLALKMLPHQKWFNLCMTLDVIGNETLTEVRDGNPFFMSETRLSEYNELDVNMMVMLIIHHFYIKNDGDMVLQCHRGRMGPRYLALLDIILRRQYHLTVIRNKDVWVFQFDNGFKLKCLTGYRRDTITTHPEYTYLFSLSLMCGFDPAIRSGTMVLPRYVIPYDKDNFVLSLSQKSEMNNHLPFIIDDVLNVDQEAFFDVVDKLFSNEELTTLKKLFKVDDIVLRNPDKNHKVRRLVVTDFLFNKTICVLDDLFDLEPLDMDRPILIQ